MLPLVEKYFNEISDLQLSQLEKYKNILLDWNTKINLISERIRIISKNIIYFIALQLLNFTILFLNKKL